jgi:RND family efflux transporter MFP subunit
MFNYKHTISKITALVLKLSLRVRLAILAGLVLLATAGAYGVYSAAAGQTNSTDQSALQTAVVRRGDLTLYASGSGTLTAADEADLAFKTGGQVTKVLVKVGDEVKAGDLLAQVDDTDAQVAYAQAKRSLAELASAAAVAQAQEDVATAISAVSDAKNALVYLISPNVYYWEQQVEQAQVALAHAKAEAGASPTSAEQKKIDEAADRLKYYQDSLAGSKVGYEKNYVPTHFTVITRDARTHKSVKTVQGPTEAEIAAAEAAYAVAQADLQEAQWYLAALQGEEIPENATGSNLTALEQAQLDLRAAQNDLDGTRIVAPFDGTVMAVDTSPGNTVSSSTTMITVADLSRPSLEVFLDESDWNNVQTGYEAEVIFDILTDRTFSGKVTQVDPGLYTESGSSVVRALVQLDPVDDYVSLPLGTSAAVDIIGGRAQDAVLVPVEALHEAGGQYTVFAVENGVLKLRVVEVGIQDLVYAEIKSGLQPGDVVSTGIAETK